MRGTVPHMTLPFPEYDTLDGLAISGLVRSGEVRVSEVIEAALARIAHRNAPSMPSFVCSNAKRAQPQAISLRMRRSLACPW